jgi:hypothetical protein
MRCRRLIAAVSTVLFGLAAHSATAQVTKPHFTLRLSGDAVTVQGTAGADVSKVVVCYWNAEGKGKSASAKWVGWNATDPLPETCTGGAIAAQGEVPGDGAAKASTAAGTLTVNSDGTFSGTLQAQAGAAFGQGTYFAVYSVLRTGMTAASLTASRYRDAGGAAVDGGAKTAETLDVTLPYCDQSPPYQYTETTAGTASVVLAASERTQLQSMFAASPVTVKADDPTPFQNFADAGVHDPIDGPALINDAGDPILTADPATSFAANTASAQRLLIRTQFRPNFSRLACSYAYLTGTLPRGDEPALDFNGKPENITASPASSTFAFTGSGAPQYYLFNIVRWSDAPPVKNQVAQTKTKTPTKTDASTSGQSLYQATSEWYLLNYSDTIGHRHDLLTRFRKFQPEFEQDTIRVLGTSRVVFVGVHLAPPAKYSGALPATVPGLPLIPTEQAWFDNTTIQYKFAATSVDPVNVADLKTLINQVVGVSSLSGGAAARMMSTGPPRSAAGMAALEKLEQTPEGKAQRDSAEEVVDDFTALKTSCYGYKQKEAIDCFLGGVRSSGDAQSASFVKAVTQYPEPDCQAMKAALAGKTDLASLSSQSGTVSFCLFEALVSDADAKGAEGLIASEQGALDKLVKGLEAHDLPQVYSTYQGLYTAGLLTNLTDLPAAFVGAANITGSWTATFAPQKAAATEPETPGKKPTDAAPAGDSTAPAPPSKSDEPPTAEFSGPDAGGATLYAMAVPQSADITQASASKPAKKPAKPAKKPTTTTKPAAGTTTAGKSSLCPQTSTAQADGSAVQTPCTSTGPAAPGVHDEGIAYWDVSIAVPVQGFRDVGYKQSTTGGAGTLNLPTAASATRENAYGMFDMFVLGGEDLYTPPTIGLPYVSVGVPISGKVFDKPYFALGEMVNLQSVGKMGVVGKYVAKYLPVQLRPMYGLVWNKEFKTIPASGTTPAETVFYRRALDPQFSIEISIKSVASKLNKSGSSKTAAKTTTTTGTPAGTTTATN